VSVVLRTSFSTSYFTFVPPGVEVTSDTWIPEISESVAAYRIPYSTFPKRPSGVHKTLLYRRQIEADITETTVKKKRQNKESVL
jgi:hypothetical protein